MSSYLDRLKQMSPADDQRPTIKGAFEAFEGEGRHTRIEKAAPAPPPVDPLAEWKRGMQRLESAPVPASVTSTEWMTVVEAATLFLFDWGQQALALGWTVGDLFGLDVTAPMRRLDRRGFAFMCARAQVVGMTAETITIRKEGALQRFYRKGSSAPAAWDEPGFFPSMGEREKAERGEGGLLSKGSKGGAT